MDADYLKGQRRSGLREIWHVYLCFLCRVTEVFTEGVSSSLLLIGFDMVSQYKRNSFWPEMLKVRYLSWQKCVEKSNLRDIWDLMWSLSSIDASKWTTILYTNHFPTVWSLQQTLFWSDIRNKYKLRHGKKLK